MKMTNKNQSLSNGITTSGNKTLRYKETSQFLDLADLVGEISSLGLVEGLQKYYNLPLEKEAKSIVAGPSFLQFLNKLFQIQVSAGDIIQFESGNNSKYYMLSVTG